MRKKITALILIAAMLASMSSGLALAAPQRFSDLSGHWSEPMITELAELGIIKGFPDGTVRPEQTITRAEFACIIARLLEMHDHVAEGDPTFDDTYDNWAHHYIEALVSAGVIDPSAVSFNPTVPITRIDMTKQLVAAIGRDGHAASNTDPTSFDDDHLIDPDHKGYINIAQLYGLINGFPDNTFKSEDISTRAEAFTIIARFYDAMETVQLEESQQTEDTDSASETDKSNSGEDNSSETDSDSGTGSDNHSGSGTGHDNGDSGNPSSPGTDKPSNPDSSGDDNSAAGPDNSLPYPVLTITNPAYGYTDTPVEIAVSADNSVSFSWRISKELPSGGIEVIWESPLITGRTSDSLSYSFNSAGTYQINCDAINADNAGTSKTTTIIIQSAQPLGRLMLPLALHTDMMMPLSLELPNGNNLTVEWSLEKDTLPVTLFDYIEGTLGDEGGTIRFVEPGVYTLTVTVTDMTGRQFSASASTTVHPVLGNEVGLPETAEADTEDGSLTIELEDTEDLTVVWKLTRNGVPVTLGDYIDGTLDESGGDIQFKVRGNYVLTASITDVTGRIHEVSSTITYYPDADIEFTLPATLYTDSNHNLTTTLTHMDDLTAVWSLTYNGSPATIADHIEGTLTNDGGSIRFKQDGTYILTATVTDELSRVISASATVIVHPLAGITFSLPEYLHTDSTHALTATLESIDGLSVQWKLKRDGGIVDLATYIEGTLTSNGGSIRFKQKGEYELIAVVTDALNREFEVSDFVTVYPVLDISFTLPGTTYTDSSNNVTVTITEQ